MQIWQRLESSGRPVYIHPDKPDWFVPNEKADRLLQALKKAGGVSEAACLINGEKPISETFLALSRLNSQIATEPPPAYNGRGKLLSLSELKECWFHLTNECNLACRHCLFGASPGKKEAISAELLKQGLTEARNLGCTLFYFTGGEPFVYPDFLSIIRELLADSAVHVVVLTNGLLLENYIEDLKSLPKDRLHLQISIDGLKESHDHLRGSGSFDRLLDNLSLLREAEIPATLSVAVSSTNVDELPDIVSLAAEQGAKNIHLLWHFVRGKGSKEQFVPSAEILPKLIESQQVAENKGVLIDNVETIKSQVFSTPATRHDLSNTAWESLAIGPDGNIYPSPALVGVDVLNCGGLQSGLAKVWKEGPVLQKIRQASLIDSEQYQKNPLKFIIGGGDIDHSYLAGGKFTGHDPYVDLYNGLALWLITNQANQYTESSSADLLLKMGDVRYDCPDGGHEVSLTHCNCVISLSDNLGHNSVREFYAKAAVLANEDIVNPFAPEQADADYIPAESKKRSYGCGSPVHDAEPKEGEVLVDLGSGSGVECFIAAAEVGAEGKVYGIDMTNEMLNLARASQEDVSRNLGYTNVEFKKGFLEDIPLEDETADAVISNCVINLSPDKRQTFHEVFRILKPGGRMVVSDIVTDEPIPVEIKNNEKYRGECLGGALQQEDLMAMLRASGFVGVRLIKRFPYRQEEGTSFYSLTFCAYKPEAFQEVDVIYRGPFGAIYTEDGKLLLKGKRTKISLQEAKALDDSVLVLDADGGVSNVLMENSCCSPTPAQNIMPISNLVPLPINGSCCDDEEKKIPDQPKIVSLPSLVSSVEDEKHQSGCMVCGSEVTYLNRDQDEDCYYCGGVKKTSTVCANGHFVCDDCHQQDGLSAIRLICLETKEQDMITLLNKIRQHPAIPMHGPEHHAMVPGIILATYRNRGGKIGKETILTGIERGSKVPGGVCGFWGSCGAAVGVGIGFSILLDATPLTPKDRQIAQNITADVLMKVSQVRGARCCQRETVTALQEAARISKDVLPVSLLAEDMINCGQYDKNKECIRKHCPLWQGDKEASGTIVS